jgi:hypothetical protein
MLIRPPPVESVVVELYQIESVTSVEGLSTAGAFARRMPCWLAITNWRLHGSAKVTLPGTDGEGMGPLGVPT